MSMTRQHIGQEGQRKAPSVRFATLFLVSCLAAGCTLFGGRQVETGQPHSLAGTSTSPAVFEVVDQQALIAAYAKLEAEIVGIKAARDIKGIEYNSVFPMGVAASFALLNMLQALQNMLSNYWSHRRELQRIVATIGMTTSSEPTAETLPIQAKAAEVQA